MVITSISKQVLLDFVSAVLQNISHVLSDLLHHTETQSAMRRKSFVLPQHRCFTCITQAFYISKTLMANKLKQISVTANFTFPQRCLIWQVHLTNPPKHLVFQPVGEKTIYQLPRLLKGGFPVVEEHRRLFDLKIWNVELDVSGEVVGSCGGHHQLVPGLLACLLSRSGDQPKFCHGCW